MDHAKIADSIRLCGSSPASFQCMEGCAYYSDGDMNKCIPRMTEDAATAITELLAENAALRKMQPVQLDDTGAKAAALAAEVSDLRQKLAEAEARCNRLDEARERANEACAKWEYRAQKAEEDRDRLREAMKLNCLMCDSMHENGNCTEVGGFCTAVPAAHCPMIPRLMARVKKLSEALELEHLRAEAAEAALKGEQNQ